MNRNDKRNRHSRSLAPLSIILAFTLFLCACGRQRQPAASAVSSETPAISSSAPPEAADSSQPPEVESAISSSAGSSEKPAASSGASSSAPQKVAEQKKPQAKPTENKQDVSSAPQKETEETPKPQPKRNVMLKAENGLYLFENGDLLVLDQNETPLPDGGKYQTLRKTPVMTNVQDINTSNYYVGESRNRYALNRSGELFSIDKSYHSTMVANNVKTLKNGAYLTKDGRLFEICDNSKPIATNVREILESRMEQKLGSLTEYYCFGHYRGTDGAIYDFNQNRKTEQEYQEYMERLQFKYSKFVYRLENGNLLVKGTVGSREFEDFTVFATGVKKVAGASTVFFITEKNELYGFGEWGIYWSPTKEQTVEKPVLLAPDAIELEALGWTVLFTDSNKKLYAVGYNGFPIRDFAYPPDNLFEGKPLSDPILMAENVEGFGELFTGAYCCDHAGNTYVWGANYYGYTREDRMQCVFCDYMLNITPFYAQGEGSGG